MDSGVGDLRSLGKRESANRAKKDTAFYTCLRDIRCGLQKSRDQQRARSATQCKFEQVSVRRRTESTSDLRGIFADHTNQCSHRRPRWPATSQARAGRKSDACGVFTGSEEQNLDQVREGFRVDLPVVHRVSVASESSTILVG